MHYGAAQSGRRWQRTLFPWLLDYGFHQHDDDSCVFSIYDTVDTPSGPREEKLIYHRRCYVDDLFCAYSLQYWHGVGDEYSHSTTSSPANCRSHGTLRTRVTYTIC